MDRVHLDPVIYRPLVDQALREDLGLAGDVTSASVVPAGVQIEAHLVARAPGRLAGLPIAIEVFRQLDPTIAVSGALDDGADLEAGQEVATLTGAAHPILAGERTALNFLTRLSGIATVTAQAVEAAKPHKARIACTRKTTPGLRALEKYAVRIGGGINHRFGLFDAVLIKDNHIAAAGGPRPAIEGARSAQGHMMKIDVEIDRLDQLPEALDAGVDAILLDNMAPETVRQAVDIVGGSAVLEASGGIQPNKVGDYAATGVDIISLGWLTHSAPGLDIGLDCVLV
jgi:nicotinate-nucleotide pyrophosphorylase (carboxylating)